MTKWSERHLKSPFTLPGNINKCLNTDGVINLASLLLKIYGIENCMASPTNPIIVPHSCKKIGHPLVVLLREGE